MSEKIFKAGGALFIISGAIGLLFWIASFFGGFASTPLPTYMEFSFGAPLEFLKLILLTVGAITVSIGLIASGLLFLRLPSLLGGGAAPASTELEEKLNRLQNIVWKLFQQVKGKGKGES